MAHYVYVVYLFFCIGFTADMDQSCTEPWTFYLLPQQNSRPLNQIKQYEDYKTAEKTSFGVDLTSNVINN